MIRKVLKNRIVRTNLIVLVPILLLLTSAAVSSIYGQLRRSNVELLTSESYNSQVYVMEQLAAGGPDSQSQRELLVTVAPYLSKNLANTVKTRVQILDGQGRVLGDSSLTRAAEPTGDVWSAVGGVKAYSFIRFYGKPAISFSSPIYNNTETVGAIRYLYQQDNLQAVSAIALILVGVCLAAVVITYVVSSYMARGIAEPVAAIRDALQDVSQGRDAHLVPLLGFGDDFEEMQEAFDTMQETNRRALQELNGEKEKQNLFFNSATHQLKTPLTSIIGYSEIIQRMTEKEDVVTSARYIEAAGKSLLETVENIISISRYNKAEYDPDPSWFQLDDLCRECSALLLPRLERSNIVLNSRCGDIQVYFDRQRLKEAIFNVLDNCILHSGCTQISVSSATWPVRLIIEDNGKGIAPQQLERVFEPFYRPAGAARGGSGLGLAICKTIMQAHGGDARVESSQGRGTRTTLIFGEETGPPPERRRL